METYAVAGIVDSRPVLSGRCAGLVRLTGLQTVPVVPQCGPVAPDFLGVDDTVRASLARLEMGEDVPYFGTAAP
jgi:hypothetical protein